MHCKPILRWLIKTQLHVNPSQTKVRKKTLLVCLLCDLGSSGGSVGQESTCNAGDPGSIPGWGRSPGEGNGNPLQYSCLETPMDRGAWQATVHGVAKSRTWLRDYTPTHTYIYMLSRFSYVWLFAILRTVAHQAPLSMGILRARMGEVCHGLSCPPPGDFCNPGYKNLPLFCLLNWQVVLYH